MLFDSKFADEQKRLRGDNDVISGHELIQRLVISGGFCPGHTREWIELMFRKGKLKKIGCDIYVRKARKDK